MTRALALVAIVVALVAPACGDDDGGDSSPGTTNGPAAGIQPCPDDSNLWDCTFHPSSTTEP